MAERKVGYFIYNLLLVFMATLLLPYFAIRNITLRRPVFPYFKKIGDGELRKLAGKPVIWIQAVSVGETVVANILLEKLRELLPDYGIVLTTTTPTGQAMAQKLLGDRAVVAYFPFDFPFLVKRFIKQVKPVLFVMTETEIWPNAIRFARQSGGKVALVNGFISDRSFKGYLKVKRFLAEVFSRVDLLVMQSAESANRIGALGAPLERIKVSGNIKFDQNYPDYPERQIIDFLRKYRWDGADKIFTAASTHHGEEEIIIDAFLRLLAEGPYKLILAPRHPERAAEVAAILDRRQLDFVKRTDNRLPEKAAAVLLLDTFGELGLAYAVAETVFVGGSLTDIGGHNVLEAAAQAKPVIYGPFMHKAKESKRLLEEADAGFTARDAAELVKIIKEITSDRRRYQKRAAAAKAAVLSNQGAALDTALLVAELIKE